MTTVTPHRVDTAALTETRARAPERVAALWEERTLRPLLPPDGRLLLVAADHPARGALGVGGDPMAMASRPDLLDRLATALERPGVDGVLGTPDVLEDLLLLGALDDKVVIGSMNRGGLQGVGLRARRPLHRLRRAQESQERGLDGGKMLTRIALDDPGTLETLQASASAVTELAARAGWRWSSRSGRSSRDGAGRATCSTPTR